MSQSETTPAAASTLSDAKRKLLGRISRGEFAKASASGQAISPRPIGEAAPLGLAQEQIWHRCLRAIDKPPLYNESITVYREGPLDIGILEQCFTEIVRRHEAWRTTYQRVSGRPLQVIHPAPVAIKIPVVDLRKMRAGDREVEAVRRATGLAQAPFDLNLGPLLRPLLFQMDEAKFRLTIIAHQSIVDGVSVYQVLPKELGALYEAFSAGKPSPLPELPIQYGDFAYWQRHWLQGEVFDQQISYWRKQLAGGLPILRLPQCRISPASETFRGVIKPFTVPRELAEAIREGCRREGTTLFMILLGGFASLLHQYSGQDDILIGTLSPAGRKRSEVQELMGYFLNPVALRFNFSGEPTFRDFLLNTRRLISEAISNDDVPLEYLAEVLKLNSARDPFVKVAVSLQPQVLTVESGWNVTSMDAQNGGTVWDLYLAFIEGENCLTGRTQYNPDVFQEATITALLEDLWRVLKMGVMNPQERVRNLLVTGV